VSPDFGTLAWFLLLHRRAVSRRRFRVIGAYRGVNLGPGPWSRRANPRGNRPRHWGDKAKKETAKEQINP
jgi:hypothetical protein